MTQPAISLPFSINSFGNITVADTPQKFWSDRVRSVIGTAIQERVMIPTFGTSIPFSVFSNQDEAQTEILNAVDKAFDTWLPALTLGNVTVTADDAGGGVNVVITYSLPTEEETSVEIGFIQVDSTNPLYEETS